MSISQLTSRRLLAITITSSLVDLYLAYNHNCEEPSIYIYIYNIETMASSDYLAAREYDIANHLYITCSWATFTAKAWCSTLYPIAVSPNPCHASSMEMCCHPFALASAAGCVNPLEIWIFIPAHTFSSWSLYQMETTWNGACTRRAVAIAGS
jgi:hypothetical protein